MSKFSEKREEHEDPPAKGGPRWLWIILVVVVLVGAWAGYDFFYYRKVSTLDDFAKCVSSKGLRMYGAWWCPHCADQKELFGYSFQYVTYTECGIENQPHSENEQCKQAGIQHFPTWQFADGSRKEGELQLSELSQRSGCKLP